MLQLIIQWAMARRKPILLWALTVVVLPVTLIFVSCATGLDWVTFCSDGDNHQEDDSDYAHTSHSLSSVTCPAERGRQLTDYWECLFRTTVTAEGWEQHHQIKLHLFHERLRLEHEVFMERRKRRCSNDTPIPGPSFIKRHRVRRQTGTSPLLPFDPNDPSTHFAFQKMLAITADLNFLGDPSIIHITSPRVRQCQLDHIWPGVSIVKFIKCLQEIMADLKEEPTVKKTMTDYGYDTVVGRSLHSTFQPTTFPPMEKSEYNKRDLPMVDFVYRTQSDSNTKKTVRLHFDFRPLNEEEHMSNFDGADTFLEDNFSPYRYHFDNLNPEQVAPSWSYRGRHPSSEWHELVLDKFLLPVSRVSIHPNDIRMELVSELAQSYPGVGEIMGKAKSVYLDAVKRPGFTELDKQDFITLARHIAIPLDHAWKKDRGFNAYTRFLIPLLDKRDVEYYRDKGTDKGMETPPEESEVLHKLASILRVGYIHEMGDSIYDYAKFTPETFHFPAYNLSKPNHFYQPYLAFIEHFFNIDISNWMVFKEQYGNTSVTQSQTSPLKKPYLLSMDLDAVRRVVNWYLEVVMPQIDCLRILIQHGAEGRRLVSKELDEAIPEAFRPYIPVPGVPFRLPPTIVCRVGENRRDTLYYQALDPNDRWNYLVPMDQLKSLYNSYYDRKEARQRYSIPVIPESFPVCRSKDPSPIDIQTRKTRQSNIKDYSFGKGAYRLNRFFMFLPLDDSPLLTLGIVDGQRLDDSSVRLSGGAVKGENLTFQYMHFKFASRWDKIGSEHWMDGVGAPMELQMVFTIAGSADSVKYWHVLARVINQLFQFRDKLAIVLSVLVEVLPTDELVNKTIHEKQMNQDPYLFEPLAQAAYHFRSMPLKYPESEDPRGYVSRDPVFRFIDFIPRKSSYFYTYRGSLSWPPCFPYVIWSVFKERLYMSKRQFDQFARIPAWGTQDTSFLGDNFRRFSDIKVQAEENSSLSYDQLQKMIRERTVDREILVGYHDVESDGKEYEEAGVVGEEIYYVNWEKVKDTASTLKLEVKVFYVCIAMLVCYLFCILI